MTETDALLFELRATQDVVREMFFALTGRGRVTPDLRERAIWIIKMSGRPHPEAGECNQDIKGTTCSECIKLGIERWPHGTSNVEPSL